MSDSREAGGQEEQVNVLIVDDQEENLLAFSTILEDLGQKIVTPHTGEEALRLVYKEDFAVIHHDLRGALRAINGYAEILSQEYAARTPDESGVKSLQRICESARQMNTLIDDLLSFSRLARDKIVMVPLDLPAVLAECLRPALV